jgi:hypothetical protein
MAWVKVSTGTNVTLYTDAEGAQSDKKLHPYIASILGERRQWSQKHELRQPLTGPIIEQMAHMVAETTKTITTVVGLDRLSTLYDWIYQVSLLSSD